MRIFASERVSNLLKRFGMDDGVEISHPMVTRAIERAQKKVEQRNFEIRKNLLEYDGVMDQQRKLIYRIRHRILMSEDLEGLVREHVGDAVRGYANSILDVENREEGEEQVVADWIRERFGIELSPDVVATVDVDRYVDAVSVGYGSVLKEKQEQFGEQFIAILHYIMLRAVDDKWKDHLREMDHLRAGIGMRSYAQVDPKLEYKREGFQLFSAMLQGLKEEYCSLIPRIRIKIDEEEAERELASTWKGGSTVSGQQVQQQFQDHGRRQERVIEGSKQKSGPVQPIVNAAPKVGRNDPCHCGSGLKFKKCHGKEEAV